MDVINVITVSEGVINDIISFSVVDPQLSGEIVESAEKRFAIEAKMAGAKDEDMYEHLENGYYLNEARDYSVNIVWSQVDA